MRIEVAGHTHVGMKRTHNEDNFLLLPEADLYCVADGMGGHSAGEIASRIAVDEMAEFFRMTSRDNEATWPYKMERARNYDENRLATGIKLANLRIFEHATQTPKYKGMGTTIVAVHVANDVAYVGHVGDSRVYLVRAGELRQLTEDHSLLNQFMQTKRLTPEEIAAFPGKNIIVRALGMKDSVQVDVTKLELREGDVFLLCSDGLSGMVTDEQIRQILTTDSDLDQACTHLIEQANAAGGTDNITCVLARVRAS